MLYDVITGAIWVSEGRHCSLPHWWPFRDLRKMKTRWIPHTYNTKHYHNEFVFDMVSYNQGVWWHIKTTALEHEGEYLATQPAHIHGNANDRPWQPILICLCSAEIASLLKASVCCTPPATKAMSHWSSEVFEPLSSFQLALALIAASATHD